VSAAGFALWLFATAAAAADLGVAVLVSADAEWKAVGPAFPDAKPERSPYGEYFFASVGGETVLFFHGGWGKVAAAGSTQYVIDRFKPRQLINLGTCGGVEGRIRRFDVVAVEKAIIYDIFEAMGNSAEAVRHYTTWLRVPAPPVPVVRATIYSADRDLTPSGLREIDARYAPVAVDWESGAIAFVAGRNRTPLLILRGVSDLVSVTKGEAVGNPSLFERNAAQIMRNLLGDLPLWLRALRN